MSIMLNTAAYLIVDDDKGQRQTDHVFIHSDLATVDADVSAKLIIRFREYLIC